MPPLTGLGYSFGRRFSTKMSRLRRWKPRLGRSKALRAIAAFQEEYVAFLQKHGVEYEEKFLW